MRFYKGRYDHYVEIENTGESLWFSVALGGTATDGEVFFARHFASPSVMSLAKKTTAHKLGCLVRKDSEVGMVPFFLLQLLNLPRCRSKTEQFLKAVQDYLRRVASQTS